MDELIEAFSIERVHKSGSRFDPEKARWFNHHYLQIKPETQLALEFREDLRARGYHIDISELEILIRMVKERVSFVHEFWNETDFFFKAPETYDKEVIRKRWKKDSPVLMSGLRVVLENITEFSKERVENIVKIWIAKYGYDTGTVMSALRLLIVGASRGPHIFDIIGWIGKEETLSRIDKGLSAIGK